MVVRHTNQINAFLPNIAFDQCFSTAIESKLRYQPVPIHTWHSTYNLSYPCNVQIWSRYLEWDLEVKEKHANENSASRAGSPLWEFTIWLLTIDECKDLFLHSVSQHANPLDVLLIILFPPSLSIFLPCSPSFSNLTKSLSYLQLLGNPCWPWIYYLLAPASWAGIAGVCHNTWFKMDMLCV